MKVKLTGKSWAAEGLGGYITELAEDGSFTDQRGLTWDTFAEPDDLGGEDWTVTPVDEDDPTSPKHYSKGMPEGVEVIDVIRAQGWDDNFYLANATKYLLRCEHKGSKVEDLKKLLVYVGWELERLEADRD